ncbi:MAG: LysM peptidoglycan-binding domain-containing protein [Flavobacteriaceae bacterium]|nr:LysM peptidoglycan-binding domain-containing protein [Flavobacteriaceae bacterium]
MLFFSVLSFAQEQNTVLTETHEIQEVSSFVRHKVKRKETLFGIAKRYGITTDQILEHNPKLITSKLKKRMKLQIPRYRTVTVTQKSNNKLHLVQPKETLWRIAYTYGISVEELKESNPSLGEILSIGQKLIIPLSSPNIVKNTLDEDYFYYTLKPKEGYYRLYKKLGVDRKVIDSLNPNIKEMGLQVGMVIRVPKSQKSDMSVKNSLLVETISLKDSVLSNRFIKVALMAPFKASEVDLDSVENTNLLLQKRNLHTISLDFYSGASLAFQELTSLGVSLEVDVYDTENNSSKVQAILNSQSLEQKDVVIGPLIPSHVNQVSKRLHSKGVLVISPLSTKKVDLKTNVYQSIPDEKLLRKTMLNYLDRKLEKEINPCVMIIADKENQAIKKELLKRFPLAEVIDPDEMGGFVKPDLTDSLLVDVQNNWVFLETQKLNLITSITSMLNAQSSDDRDITLMTTYRGDVYDNENISYEYLGKLHFLYPSIQKPIENNPFKQFSRKYKNQYGTLPNKVVVRAYDVTLDALLRIAFQESMVSPTLVGETKYLHNKFNYQSVFSGGYTNTGVYLIQHEDLTINEIKD